MKKRDGSKIQCITPPQYGFPVDDEGKETVCFENVLGTTTGMCAPLHLDGQIYNTNYYCRDTCGNPPRGLDIIVYPKNIFSFGLREICEIPIDGSPICEQSDIRLFSTTAGSYDLHAVSNTKAEIYIEQNNSMNFIATITHRLPSYSTFNPIPWITITPDQEYLIYATDYLAPNTVEIKQISCTY